MGYNYYRKRKFNISKTKAREYASEMETLEKDIYDRKWNISSHLDSAYKMYEDYQIRLSNHSADNHYHNLEDGFLLVNVKMSKLNFVRYIDNDLENLIKLLNTLDLNKYRFINVVDGNANCFLKGYKTKKEVYCVESN